MKFALALTLLAMAVAVHAQSDCDPDGNNEPTCTGSNAGQTFRNFYDPVHYWQCPSGGGAAQVVACPIETLYNDATSSCIPWQDWSWTPPCL